MKLNVEISIVLMSGQLLIRKIIIILILLLHNIIKSFNIFYLHTATQQQNKMVNLIKSNNNHKVAKFH